MVGINVKNLSQALYDAVGDQKNLESALAGFERVWSDFKVAPEFARFLADAGVDFEARRAALKKMYQNDIPNPVYNLLFILMREKLLNELPELIEEIKALRMRRDGILEVTAVTARPISEAVLEKIREAVAAKTGKRPIVGVEINEKIIGGLILKINDLTIDGSVAGRIERLKNKIKTLS